MGRSTTPPPPDPIGTVIFAHGSGGGRFSLRNQRIAADFVRAGLATLLMDLLTEAEEAVDRKSEHLRVDLRLLADGSAQWRAGAIQPTIQACVGPRRTPKQPT